MTLFSKIPNFIKEVISEMKKVSWPTKKETLRYTLIVLGVSAVVASFLGLIDFLFQNLLNKVLI